MTTAVKKTFFKLPDGREVSLYRLRLADGFGADITDFGGCVTALYTPDRQGVLRDVVLGWREPEAYLENPGYLGALVGRVPNRIGGGRFMLNDQVYQLSLNDRGHSTLHGGNGFSHRLWTVESFAADRLVLTLDSPDKDAGFPGNVRVRAVYALYEDHTLELEFTIESDSFTVADLTNHTYFNLEGENTGVCDTHFITLNSDRVTETDEYLVPTGNLLKVDQTRFDLREGKSFRQILAETPGGFDDNFIIAEKDGIYQENAAVVYGKNSGIIMRIHTSRPGIQFYMGEYLEDSCGYSGKRCSYIRNGGFCLETQCWPDAVNNPEFPQIHVAPGRPRHGMTRWQFGVI